MRLPTVLWCAIAEHLQGADVARMRSTCRVLRDGLNHNGLWALLLRREYVCDPACWPPTHTVDVGVGGQALSRYRERRALRASWKEARLRCWTASASWATGSNDTRRPFCVDEDECMVLRGSCVYMSTETAGKIGVVSIERQRVGERLAGWRAHLGTSKLLCLHVATVQPQQQLLLSASDQDVAVWEFAGPHSLVPDLTRRLPWNTHTPSRARLWHLQPTGGSTGAAYIVAHSYAGDRRTWTHVWHAATGALLHAAAAVSDHDVVVSAAPGCCGALPVLVLLRECARQVVVQLLDWQTLVPVAEQCMAFASPYTHSVVPIWTDWPDPRHLWFALVGKDTHVFRCPTRVASTSAFCAALPQLVRYVPDYCPSLVSQQALRLLDDRHLALAGAGALLRVFDLGAEPPLVCAFAPTPAALGQGTRYIGASPMNEHYLACLTLTRQLCVVAFGD